MRILHVSEIVTLELFFYLTVSRFTYIDFHKSCYVCLCPLGFTRIEESVVVPFEYRNGSVVFDKSKVDPYRLAWSCDRLQRVIRIWKPSRSCRTIPQSSFRFKDESSVTEFSSIERRCSRTANETKRKVHTAATFIATELFIAFSLLFIFMQKMVKRVTTMWGIVTQQNAREQSMTRW